MPAQAPEDIRGYVICTTARSGSNYVCQLLASTGRLGRAEEYFHAEARRRNGMADYPDDPEAQLGMVMSAGATPNGVYALKIFPNQFDAVAALRWPARLPNLTWVHLERRDLLGQAISMARAIQTGGFRAVHAPRREPVYDGAAINNALIQFIRDHARWRFHFARNGIDPVRLVYEDVMADPASAVRMLAAALGLSGEFVVDMNQVQVTVQRDALSEEWRGRFLAEQYDPCAFK
jgi:LPS sulfotransferase NodH